MPDAEKSAKQLRPELVRAATGNGGDSGTSPKAYGGKLPYQVSGRSDVVPRPKFHHNSPNLCPLGREVSGFKFKVPSSPWPSPTLNVEP